MDSKRIALTLTLPTTDMLQEVVANQMLAVINGLGYQAQTMTASISSPGTAQCYGDVLVPTGQADPTTVTAITNAVQAYASDAGSYTVTACSSTTTPAEPVG